MCFFGPKITFHSPGQITSNFQENRKKKTDILQSGWPPYDQLIVNFFGVCNKQVFLVKKHCFKPFLVGQNFNICLRSGSRGLTQPPHHLKLPFKYDHWDFANKLFGKTLGNYLRREIYPEQFRQDRKDRGDTEDTEDTEDRQEKDYWHLNFAFQDACVGYLLHSSDVW